MSLCYVKRSFKLLWTRKKNDVITTNVTKYYNSLWYKKLSWSSFDSKNLFQVIYDLLRKTKAAPPIIVIWWFCNYYKNENQNKTWSIGNDVYVSSNLNRLDIAACQLGIYDPMTHANGKKLSWHAYHWILWKGSSYFCSNQSKSTT